jgi:arginine deiminase
MKTFTSICYICLTLCILSATSCQSLATVSDTSAHPLAEYDNAKLILTHEPSEELFLGVIHPDAALFESYFNTKQAAAEHAGYRKLLQKAGITVLTVRDILLRGTLDQAGNPLAGSALDSLRAFASQFLTYDSSEIEGDSIQQAAYKQQVVSQMAPNDLIHTIMLQPTVHLQKTPGNTGYAATYTEKPLMNLYFMRDQMITTNRGVVLGHMHSPQRNDEVLIADFCLDKIGYSPIGRITGDDAYLEGGDFIAFGQSAFIGCGLRTTLPAINELMENDWLGCDTLIVVNDSWHQQEQMHLDTYFNIIDKDLATLSEPRYLAASDTTSSRHLTIDIYARHHSEQGAGNYELVASKLNFVDYLENHLKIRIIPVSPADEATFACNYLTIGARRIMAVAGQSEAFQKALADNGVKVTWVPLDNLIKGYGAAHCMTQVLSRQP